MTEPPKKEKKTRRSYGSFAWRDKKSGYLYSRVRVKQPNGKTKTIYKRAKNITHAKQLADEIKADYETRGDSFLEGLELTFEKGADWYKNKFVTPPVYSGSGQKIKGMRTWEFERGKIERLKLFFGAMLVSEVTERTLEYFAQERKKENVKQVTINRDLETLRAMFGKFKRQRWIAESPFEFGEQLISKAFEERRQITLNDEQEIALLESARLNKQILLYPLILVLRDCGARPSEIYPVNERPGSGVKYKPVQWLDFFDFDFKAVRLTSFKGKQVKIRFAPVTKRMRTALFDLRSNLKKERLAETSFIFPHKSYKSAWGNVREKAKFYLRVSQKKKVPVIQLFDGTIKLTAEEITNLKGIFTAEDLKARKAKKAVFSFDIRLRDLRRDFRTRLARAGYSDQLAQRLLGHESADTTFLYTEADLKAVYLAGNVLDSQNESQNVIEIDGAEN